MKQIKIDYPYLRLGDHGANVDMVIGYHSISLIEPRKLFKIYRANFRFLQLLGLQLSFIPSKTPARRSAIATRRIPASPHYMRNHSLSATILHSID